MQIQSYNQVNNQQNPNFTALRSVRCEGLFKKFPELANELVDTFSKNPKAKEFYEKFDGDVVFFAKKSGYHSIETSIHMLYDNPTIKGFSKLMKKLFGSRDEIKIHALANNYIEQDCMTLATKKLIRDISPERKVDDHFVGGLLDSHIDLHTKNIEEKVSKLAKTEAEKAAKEQEKAMAKSAKKQAQAELDKAMDRLKNNFNNDYD